MNCFPSATGLRSVPVNEDDPSHRVHPMYHDNLLKSPPNRKSEIRTMYDLIAEAFGSYADRRCMGTRPFLGWHSAKVRRFGTDIRWRTFSDIEREAYRWGAALRRVGMEPAPSMTNLDKVSNSSRMAIFENTCAEWMVACIGAFTQSIAITTVYATLGMEAVVEAVNDNAITVLLCNKKNVAFVVQQSQKMPTLHHIIYTNDQVAPDDEDLKLPMTKPKNLTVISFDDFVESGDPDEYPPHPPTPHSCAVVMYTSGSTGKPKGVLILHRHLVAACGALEIMLAIRPGEDVYLAYLPLAHIMEIIAEFVLLSLGCTLAYADPKSLTATGAHPVGALEQFSPTLMVAVPKIWDVIRKGILAKIDEKSSVAKMLVNTAFDWRNFALKNGFDTPVFNALVFNNFRKVVGGKLRMALSGGGPLNAEVQDFIRTAFGIDFIQGYGLTETCATTLVQATDDLRGNIAGQIVPSVEIKLFSTPDVCDRAGQPYLSTDRRDAEGNPIFGRGEIAVRGNNISLGYYMMPDKTREAYDDEGWFHTGDIGQFMSDGSVRIVDRKKNLVKLKGGEYIAIEKMETVYGNSNFIDSVKGGICCYGDGEMDRPVAMVQLSEVATMKWAKSKGIAGEFPSIQGSKELYDAVLADLLEQHAKSEELSHLEKLAAISILSTPFTPDNGCLTAANKLQRRQVVEVFKKEFEQVRKKGIF